VLTGELRNQIDSIWNDFWSGGLANPLQVIEQITYLIFIKRLDEMQELEERKATTLGKPIERRGEIALFDCLSRELAERACVSAIRPTVPPNAAGLSFIPQLLARRARSAVWSDRRQILLVVTITSASKCSVQRAGQGRACSGGALLKGHAPCGTPSRRTTAESGSKHSAPARLPAGDRPVTATQRGYGC
jgi:HsdM N-terminal domain